MMAMAMAAKITAKGLARPRRRCLDLLGLLSHIDGEINRERYVNHILRNVIAMERLAEARGVQLKASVPSTTITN
jgi:hypothetical protein